MRLSQGRPWSESVFGCQGYGCCQWPLQRANDYGAEMRVRSQGRRWRNAGVLA